MDGLSNKLTSANVGCNINNTPYAFNHVMYADNTVLISLSFGGLQHMLLNICDIYAKQCDVLFNVRKTFTMCNKPKGINLCKIPKVYLSGQSLSIVTEYKYFGVFISDSCKDDRDISRQLHSLYARRNSLLSNLRFVVKRSSVNFLRLIVTVFIAINSGVTIRLNYSGDLVLLIIEFLETL